MRFARICFSIILTATLIFLLAFSSSAVSEEESMYIYGINTLYAGQPGISPYYIEKLYIDEPTDSGVYSYSIDGTIMLNQLEYQAQSLNILGYTNEIELWQQGYIYTFNYDIRVNNSSVPQPTEVTFTFGVAQLKEDGETISLFQALGDVIYTYTVSGSYTIYHVTSTVYVDETFPGGNVGNLSEAYTSLEMSIFEQESVKVNVRLSNVKAQKAIGEDAYYQASIDAINDLDSTMKEVNDSVNKLPMSIVDAEYNFIFNAMPDELGEMETVKGDVLDITTHVSNDINGFYDRVSALMEQTPLIYMPDIVIPLGDGVTIDLYSQTPLGDYVGADHYFRPLNMLSSMNPTISSILDNAVLFVRLVAIVTFFTVGMWRMFRIEWWY